MDALLGDLQALARERSREHRAVLLRRLTDLFFRNLGRQNARMLGLFEDIISRVLEDVDIKARIELSDRLAMAPSAPHRVVRTLAEDEFPVAEPILRHSPVLTDDDLLVIAHRRGDAHRVAMSRRVYVSERVTDALIERGHPDIQRAIAGNEGAQITGAGYDRLLRDAAGDKVLQELMALRSNLPQTVRSELLPVLAAEVRRRVLARLAEGTQDIISRALESEVDAIVDRVDEVSKDRAAFEELQTAFDEGNVTLDEALQEACRNDRHDWVVDMLVFVGPLDRAHVVQTLLERDPKPIAVLLKAHDVAPETFQLILEMRAKHLRVGSNSPSLVEDYAKLDCEVAHTVLRHLRLRMSSAA